MIRRQRQIDVEEVSSTNLEPTTDDAAPARKIALGPRLPVPAYRGDALALWQANILCFLMFYQ
jgi:hypothetical protein